MRSERIPPVTPEYAPDGRKEGACRSDLRATFERAFAWNRVSLHPENDGIVAGLTRACNAPASPQRPLRKWPPWRMPDLPIEDRTSRAVLIETSLELW